MRRRAIGVSILIRVIRGYQQYLSVFLPPACRFYPSCSEYAVQVLDFYGPWRGGAKALWRVLRCHPFSPGGVDLPTPQGDDSL